MIDISLRSRARPLVALVVVALILHCAPLPTGPEQIEASGEIASNTTWSGEITLTGDVVVRSGVLTIEPGTIVKADTITIIRADTSGDGITYDTSGIRLTVEGDGAIYAVGALDKPIIFSSASQSPAAGDWSGIRLSKLTNDDASLFRYCLVEYSINGFLVGSWDDSLAALEPSDARIDSCVVRYTSASGIYGTNGGNITVSHCVIHDCGSGIFLHGFGTAAISYTYVYNVSAGIILNGLAETNDIATIDHVTVYNVDGTLVASPRPWTGYGVSARWGGGQADMTNSIVAKSSSYGLSIMDMGWTGSFDYNGYYENVSGAVFLATGQMGANSVEADPLFTDADGGDFTLQGTSPYLAAGKDGGNIGAWQGGDLWWSAW